MRRHLVAVVLVVHGLIAGCSDAPKTGAIGAPPSTAQAIEQVLAADKNAYAEAASISDVVARMHEIDIARCPSDFRSAFLAHLHAWENMADVERDAHDLKNTAESEAVLVESFVRGFLVDPFGKANEILAAHTQLQREYQAANQQIKLTYQQLEENAVYHGASSPAGTRFADPSPPQRWPYPRITSVSDDGLGASAGIRPGDLLIEYDGVSLHTEGRTNDETYGAMSRAMQSAAGKKYPN